MKLSPGNVTSLRAGTGINCDGFNVLDMALMALEKVTFSGGNGLRLAADRGGDPARPSIVLLHGGGQTRHSWGRAARDFLRMQPGRDHSPQLEHMSRRMEAAARSVKVPTLLVRGRQSNVVSRAESTT